MALTTVLDRSEDSAAFRLLTEILKKDAEVFREQPIGWQGGSVRRTAYWLPLHDIWAVLEPSPPEGKRGPGRRFWNCFGVGKPINGRMISIVVEINPPHEGEDRRVAGLFARDETGNLYIAHTGKLGGGRKGIGMNAFRQFLDDDDWAEIETPSGLRKVIVLGPIDGPDFQSQLSTFVHRAAEFKAGRR